MHMQEVEQSVSGPSVIFVVVHLIAMSQDVHCRLSKWPVLQNVRDVTKGMNLHVYL